MIETILRALFLAGLIWVLVAIISEDIDCLLERGEGQGYEGKKQK